MAEEENVYDSELVCDKENGEYNASPKTTNVGKIQDHTSKNMPGRPEFAYLNYTQHPQHQTPRIFTSAISKHDPKKTM
jgi:hypothetical protein